MIFYGSCSPKGQHCSPVFGYTSPFQTELLRQSYTLYSALNRLINFLSNILLASSNCGKRCSLTLDLIVFSTISRLKSISVVAIAIPHFNSSLPFRPELLLAACKVSVWMIFHRSGMIDASECQPLKLVHPNPYRYDRIK